MALPAKPPGAITASKYAIEGFSESLAYELGMFGVRVKIVQPGLAPSTSFAANSGGRCDNLIPAAYADYAGRYLKSMQEYPTAYTSAEDVAEAVYAAATDGRDKLRYPVGADSVMLAALPSCCPQARNSHSFSTMKRFTADLLNCAGKVQKIFKYQCFLSSLREWIQRRTLLSHCSQGCMSMA